MPIFQIKDNKVSQISSNIDFFKNEAELRDFFAENLEELLGMKFLAKEYPTSDGRMDTIAIDENNSPVIIEYKWGQDGAIVVQGMFYFNWLKENKKHFDLLVANKFGNNIKINWDKPRVLLIAQGFDYRTMVAVKQTDYIELIRYVPYKENVLYLENIQSSNKSKAFKIGSKKHKELSDEIKDIDYHIKKSFKEVQEIFYALQKKIIDLPNVKEMVNQKTGITYRTTKSFTRFEFGKSYISVLVKEPKYNDPQNLVQDITKNMWGYKGRIKISEIKKVNDVFDIVKQSYQETL